MANVFHATASVSRLASIDVSSRGTDTVIGEKSVIDDFVRIKHVGGAGHVKVGNYVYINSGTVIYSGNGVLIADHVLIGPNCNLVPVNHNIARVDELIRLQGFAPSKGGVRIDANVWLGAGVTVVDGAHIEEGVVVGANSLVIGKLEANCIYAGSPAVKIRQR